MKKYISVLLLLFLLSNLAYAESMKFITVLSSPVGSFNKLETVDSQTPVVGQTVNFCTQLGNSGTVELKGTGATELSHIVLFDNTVLGRRSGGKFSLKDIELRREGSIIGGQLLGNTLMVKSSSVGKANKVQGNTLAVTGAKTGRLTITGSTGHDSQITQSASDREMVWSNEYQSDTACSTNCSKQYLLKSKGTGSTTSDCSTPPNGQRRQIARECGKNKAPLYETWNAGACKYVEDAYVELTLKCITHYCPSSETGKGAFYGGCLLDREAPSYIEYWEKYGGNFWKQGLIAPGEMISWQDGFDPYSGNYSSKVREFYFENKQKEFVFNEDGCAFKIKVEEDIIEEDVSDYNDGYFCRSASSWW